MHLVKLTIQGMINDLYIAGAGGFGNEVRSLVTSLGYSFKGFIDDLDRNQSVISDLNSFDKVGNIVLAIGNSESRQRAWNKLKPKVDLKYIPSIISKDAFFYEPLSSMGIGNIITPNCTLTTNIAMGDFCVVNINATIGHNTKLGNFVSIMPGAHISGDVILEDGAYVGSGAVILQGIRIGKSSVVGAGSVVTRDVKPNTVVIGSPAQELKNK